MKAGLVLLVAGLAALPQVVPAQQSTGAPPRRFDAEFGYLSFSWVARPSDSFALGPEIGAGSLKQVVITPGRDDLTGIAHVGMTSTLRLGAHVDLEVAARAGLAELRSVACAGCVRNYHGLALAMLAGQRRVRFGTRLAGGRIEGDRLLAWSPLVLRIQF